VALLEPALILIFGALVGFVALGMLQAIYGINSRRSRGPAPATPAVRAGAEDGIDRLDLVAQRMPVLHPG